MDDSLPLHLIPPANVGLISPSIALILFTLQFLASQIHNRIRNLKKINHTKPDHPLHAQKNQGGAANTGMERTHE